jgi:hypothetical protein
LGRRTSRIDLFVQGVRKVSATLVPVLGSLSEADGEYWVELGKAGSAVSQCGWWHVEMVADDDGGIRVRKQLRTGQQVVGGGRQRVLVGAAIDVFA